MPLVVRCRQGLQVGVTPQSWVPAGCAVCPATALIEAAQAEFR
jgi:hypothetical protein